MDRLGGARLFTLRFLWRFTEGDLELLDREAGGGPRGAAAPFRSRVARSFGPRERETWR